MSQVSPNLTLHRRVSGSGEAAALDVSVQDLVCQANVLLLFPPVNCEQMRARQGLAVDTPEAVSYSMGIIGLSIPFRDKLKIISSECNMFFLCSITKIIFFFISNVAFTLI